ncbi:MAG TPA: NADH-quinone oxidoreductase subunit L [Actinomycetota bacterium]|nr:NADH-quinone oxidoreductase subunit L [Actinomycetota bacterium]
MIRGAWLIPLLPLAAFFLILFFGKRSPRHGAPIGIAAVAVSWVLSIGVLLQIAQDHPAVERSIEWFNIGSFRLELGMAVDGLAAVMFFVVTTVSLCVQVYSLGYMHGDSRFTWFYAQLSLFTAAMLNVVIANNLFQLLVGWEVMGLCSYFLIGHWWEDKVNSDAGIKAFITTRTGDIPFLFGIFVLTVAAGFDTNIGHIADLAEHGQISTVLLTAGALLLFGGAIGKSAQFPLHVWLPDAMAGPTPVSALIHAATMVAAGVYLVGRMFAVFVHASAGVLQFVAVIASITMLIAALLAMIQDDIKRVLAYSTVSQLDYMMVGLSLGEAGYTAGLFHLFTHAFFKALLFLAAGSVIHAVHSNYMSEMGGLRSKMPVTFWTFVIGAAALSNIPPFAGFWSKDEIISTAFHSGHYFVWAVAFVTAIVTAFYMTRAVLLTFFGDYRGTAHPHEAPVSITAPLVLLAFLSVTAGFLNATAFNLPAPFTAWVHFGAAEHEPFNYGFAAVSILGAAGGLAVGYRLYRGWRERDPVRNLGPVYTVLERKYYLDDIYMGGVVRPIQYRLSAAANWFNQRVLDGIVDGAAVVTRWFASLVNLFDQKAVDGAVNGAAGLTGFTGGILRYLQSGNVQRYAVFLFAGVVALAVIFTRL